MILKTFFFFQFLPRIYVFFLYIYSKNTIFSFVFCPELSIQLFSYIYNKHSFFFLRPCPDQFLVHIFLIQTTLFSLVFAQYLSYIMYYSYIQNKYLFFSFRLDIYIVKFLCFSYILKTIENVYFPIQEIPLFFFVFPDI